MWYPSIPRRSAGNCSSFAFVSWTQRMSGRSSSNQSRNPFRWAARMPFTFQETIFIVANAKPPHGYLAELSRHDTIPGDRGVPSHDDHARRPRRAESRRPCLQRYRPPSFRRRPESREPGQRENDDSSTDWYKIPSQSEMNTGRPHDVRHDHHRRRNNRRRKRQSPLRGRYRDRRGQDHGDRRPQPSGDAPLHRRLPSKWSAPASSTCTRTPTAR